MAKTPFQAKGYTKSTVFLTSGDCTWAPNHKAVLHRDDGTSCPQFLIIANGRHKKSAGKTLYIYMDRLTPIFEGPEAGVSWAERPAGATHYSTDGSHANRWHRVVKGEMQFDYRTGLNHGEVGNWKLYGTFHADPTLSCYIEIPEEYLDFSGQAALLAYKRPKQPEVEVEPLDAIAKRMSRTGAKIGRTKVLLAEQEAKLEALKQEFAEAKKQQGYTPKITCAKELVEVMHDPSRWKEGMTVVCRTDEGGDIKQGNKYVLTGNSDGIIINFKDDVGVPRQRLARNYQLVTSLLV